MFLLKEEYKNMSKKYEYKIFYAKTDSKFDKVVFLNALGEDGWIVIEENVISSFTTNDDYRVVAYRQKD